ncbi:MAG: DUF4397 domain-containing protein [Enhygromyxa sp.]
MLPVTFALACNDDTTVTEDETGTGTETGDGDGDTGDGDGDTGDGDGDTGDGDGDTGDGDGDTGDGDGDTGDGDGDTGDGDGDTGDGDGDTGDGDGDTGDGDGDTGDGDGDTGDGDGDTGDGDGDTGDGDGDTGDGDGDTGDGDGDTGDGDGDTGDGDGDAGLAELRVLHLGPDAATLDVFIDGDAEPIATLDFENGTAYAMVPAGEHTITVTPEDDPDTTLLTLNPVVLAEDAMYSVAVYDYLANFAGLLLSDDGSGLDPAETRLQVSHLAADADATVDVWVLSPPTLLVDDLAYGEATVLDVLPLETDIGLDFDNDGVYDLTFTVPSFGAGNLVDIYAVNEDGGSPLFLLAHLPDGTTTRINAHACGDGVVEGLEVCDGDAGDLSCEDFQDYTGGTLGCLDDCSDYDTSMCTSQQQPLVYCNSAVTPIPDGGGQPAVTIPIVVPDGGTVAAVEVSVNISHTYLNDLSAWLEKDEDESIILFHDIFRADAVGSCTGDDMVALLTEDSDLYIQNEACYPNEVPAVEGEFYPFGLLTDFNGLDIAGTWNLVVDDQNGGDAGQVNEWCVYITPN